MLYDDDHAGNLSAICILTLSVYCEIFPVTSQGVKLCPLSYLWLQAEYNLLDYMNMEEKTWSWQFLLRFFSYGGLILVLTYFILYSRSK